MAMRLFGNMLADNNRQLQVRSVAPGVEQLFLSTLRNRLAGFGSTCFRVDDVLIDCSFAHVRRVLVRHLERRPPRAVYLTHHHEDHAGNCGMLQSRFGCPVYLRLPDLRYSERVMDPPLYRRLFWGPVGPYRATEMPEVIETDHRKLLVIDAGGHTRTQVAFFDETDGLLFCGDLFIAKGASEATPSEDPYETAAALRRVAALEPRLLLNGHGLILEEPAAALLTKAGRIEEAIDRVLELAAAGNSTPAIISEALRGGGRKDRVMAWLTQGDFSKENLVQVIIERRPDHRGLHGSKTGPSFSGAGAGTHPAGPVDPEVR